MNIFDVLEDDTLAESLKFILEVSKLKSVMRQTYLNNDQRYENSAEHSWHLIMMAITLQNIQHMPLDITKIVKMLAIHDLGEIEIGDTFHYHKKENNSDVELLCIQNLTQNLQEPIKSELVDLWKEFEKQETPEAKFCNSLDRLQPFLEQLHNGGESWRRNKISYKLALEKNAHIEDGAPVLWDAYQKLAQKAEQYGLFYKEAS